MNNRISAEVFPPGEFLGDELEARGWTQTEFAEIISRPQKLVNDIVLGKRSVTPETAADFFAALGTAARFLEDPENGRATSEGPPPRQLNRPANKMGRAFSCSRNGEEGLGKPR